MSLDILYHQKLFEEYQAGHLASLTQLFDEERPYLFDYLLRMTGDVKRSLDTIAQIEAIINSGESSWANLGQWRLAIYERSRRFNAGFWQANVGLLQNPNLMAVLKNPEASGVEKKRANAYQCLDRAIGESVPKYREVLILHLRSKFTFSEIASIMEASPEEVAAHYGTVVQFLAERVPNLPSDPRAAISRLMPHPLPETVPSHVTDLHELIVGLRRSQGQVVGISVVSLLFGGLIFALIVASFYLDEAKIFAELKAQLAKWAHLFRTMFSSKA